MVGVVVREEHEHDHEPEQQNGTVVDVLEVIGLNQEVVDRERVGKQVDSPVHGCWEPVVVELTRSLDVHYFDLDQDDQNVEEVAEAPPFTALSIPKQF